MYASRAPISSNPLETVERADAPPHPNRAATIHSRQATAACWFRKRQAATRESYLERLKVAVELLVR